MRTEIPSGVLTSLYVAATDNSRWPEFCIALNQATGTPVKMFGHSVRSYESLGLIGAGWDPDGLAQYHQYYAALNPWMQMDVAMPVGAVGVSDAAMRRDELVRTEFYNDWLRHQGDLIAGPAMICYRSPEKFVAIAAASRRRDVDDSLPRTTGLLEALSPHMTRAIAVASTLADGTGVAAGYLESSPHAAVLVTRSGRVVYANAPAQQFLQRSGLLKIDGRGRLTSPDETVGAHLSTCAVAMQREEPERLPGPMALQDGTFGTCMLHAHLFPVSAEHAFPDAVWSDPVAGALVVTGAFGLDGPGDIEQLATALGATPAEARLAGGLMTGMTLNEYADANGLSRHTVRNQVRSLFTKTATSSQAELIRAFHRLASPFRAPPQ